MGEGSVGTGAQVCGELRAGQVSSSAQSLRWRTSCTCCIACTHSPLYPRAGEDGIICFSSVINHTAKLCGRPNCSSLQKIIIYFLFNKTQGSDGAPSCPSVVLVLSLLWLSPGCLLCMCCIANVEQMKLRYQINTVICFSVLLP